MFSGIIEDLGKVAEIKRSAEGAVFTLRTGLPIAKIKIGDSICRQRHLPDRDREGTRHA